MRNTLDRYFPAVRVSASGAAASADSGGADGDGGDGGGGDGDGDGDAAAASGKPRGGGGGATGLQAALQRAAHLRAKAPSLAPTPKPQYPGRDLRETPLPAAAEARLAALAKPGRPGRCRAKYAHPPKERHDLHERTAVAPDTLRRLEELSKPRRVNSPTHTAALTANAPASSSATGTGKGTVGKGDGRR